MGTIVSFRVGAADATVLREEFAPTFTERDLVELTKFDFYLRLMIDGVASRAFSATGLPPVSELEYRPDKIIRVSRNRYARPREMVEMKLSTWLDAGRRKSPALRS